MTHFLVSEENPNGYKLEDVLAALRKDIILRCTKIVDDQRPEAVKVMDNNMEILVLLTKAREFAENSTAVLERSFGRSEDGAPRIGIK
jgi:hypothetical protein|tara:strand:- start:8263 stop:8526 length:264 start_codon:yes stop_codon:yes gene_type:complete